MEPEILPADVTTRLTGASPTQVQELTLSKIEDYETQIVHLQGYVHRLKVIHNSSAAVHKKVPTEILMRIFRNVNPTSMRDIRLTHVCRTWRTLIHRIPEFWRDIALMLDFEKMDLQDVNQLLARTAGLCFGLQIDDAEYLTFLDTSGPFTHRLSSLKVFIQRQEDLTLLLQLNLPSLESLVLEAEENTQITPDPTAFHGNYQFPRLHSLSSIGCHPFLPAFTSRSLRHVKMSRVCLHPDDVVECLWGCYDLQTLTLNNCFSRGPQAMSRVPVELPQLQSLYLNGSSIETSILSWIVFPQTTYIEISRGDDDMSIPEPQLAFPDSLVAITSLLTRVVVSATTEAPRQMLSLAGYLSNSQQRLMIELENFELDLSEPDSGWWYAGPNLFHFLPDWFETTRGIQTLELQLQDPTLYLPQVTWESLLESFNSVSLLVIHMESCWDFFNALNSVPTPLALQELRVVHQLHLDEDDHAIIVSAVEHLVATGSPLKRLAITFQAGKRKTTSTPSQWSTEVLGRLLSAVDEVVL